jgi:hypothetical protein
VVEAVDVANVDDSVLLVVVEVEVVEVTEAVVVVIVTLASITLMDIMGTPSLARSSCWYLPGAKV